LLAVVLVDFGNSSVTTYFTLLAPGIREDTLPPWFSSEGH